MTAPAHTVCAITPGKQRHSSHADAQAVADRLNTAHRGRHTSSTYKCPCGCGSYYVTHKASKTRAQRGRSHRRARYTR